MRLSVSSTNEGRKGEGRKREREITIMGELTTRAENPSCPMEIAQEYKNSNLSYQMLANMRVEANTTCKEN